MDDMDEIICPCFDLKLKDLVDAIKKHNITTVEELSEITGAGTICGACNYELEEIVEKYKLK
ncbi:MAG: (2Fe-2S)-binding protein [Clostridia bacterium]|nr:(2Fe-2S)-binding protein [Clostridia bacterium]